MKYTARGNRSKVFTISDENSNVLGRIEYNNWFSRKAALSFNDEETFEIVPSGTWQTSFDIIRAEYKTGDIRMNWKGNIILALNGKNYLLKRAGFWQRTYVLKAAEQEIATIKQSYEWAKLGYMFEVKFEKETKDPDMALLMLLMIYCTNQQYAGAGAV
jgi:hypothetical protein